MRVGKNHDSRVGSPPGLFSFPWHYSNLASTKRNTGQVEQYATFTFMDPSVGQGQKCWEPGRATRPEGPLPLWEGSWPPHSGDMGQMMSHDHGSCQQTQPSILWPVFFFSLISDLGSPGSVKILELRKPNQEHRGALVWAVASRVSNIYCGALGRKDLWILSHGDRHLRALSSLFWKQGS